MEDQEVGELWHMLYHGPDPAWWNARMIAVIRKLVDERQKLYQVTHGWGPDYAFSAVLLDFGIDETSLTTP